MRIFDSYIQKAKNTKKQMFLEGLHLMSDFTIGFELEAFTPTKKQFKLFEIFTNNFFKNTRTIKVMDPIDEPFTNDSSIEAEGARAFPFEFRSPIFNFTPENILKIIQYLKSGITDFFSTNYSCGFHIHIGLPKQGFRQDIDSFWFLCQLAANELSDDYNKKIKRFMEYKNFNFEGDNQKIFASTILIEKIWRILKTLNKNYDKSNINKIALKKFKEVFTNDKYNFFRLHPIGTLEWRGPRDFLDKETPELIRDFFFDMLIPLIKLINDTLELNTLTYGNFSISKKEFNEIVSKLPSVIEDDSSRFNKSKMTQQDYLDINTYAPWIKKADIKNAVIKYNKRLEAIEFLDGIWQDGVWEDGWFTDGVWEKGTWNKGKFLGTWENGDWQDGFFGGIWKNGLWNDGEFDSSSTWEDGLFFGGIFKGKWLGGEFHKGIFKGKWYGGMWKGGKFEGKKMKRIIKAEK